MFISSQSTVILIRSYERLLRTHAEDAPFSEHNEAQKQPTQPLKPRTAPLEGYRQGISPLRTLSKPLTLRRIILVVTPFTYQIKLFLHKSAEAIYLFTDIT